jgi:hypothetical protein
VLVYAAFDARGDPSDDVVPSSSLSSSDRSRTGFSIHETDDMSSSTRMSSRALRSLPMMTEMS